MKIVYVLYFIIKFLVYTGWCYFAFSYLKLNYPKALSYSMLFALIRLLIGLVLGVFMGLIEATITAYLINILNSDLNARILSLSLFYLLVYMPIQWFAWSLLEIVMNKQVRRWKFFICGLNSQSRKWRAGGVFLSSLLDIPLILFVGFIVGFC